MFFNAENKKETLITKNEVIEAVCQGIQTYVLQFEKTSELSLSVRESLVAIIEMLHKTDSAYTCEGQIRAYLDARLWAIWFVNSLKANLQRELDALAKGRSGYSRTKELINITVPILHVDSNLARCILDKEPREDLLKMNRDLKDLLHEQLGVVNGERKILMECKAQMAILKQEMDLLKVTFKKLTGEELKLPMESFRSTTVECIDIIPASAHERVETFLAEGFSSTITLSSEDKTKDSYFKWAFIDFKTVFVESLEKRLKDIFPLTKPTIATFVLDELAQPQYSHMNQLRASAMILAIELPKKEYVECSDKKEIFECIEQYIQTETNYSTLLLVMRCLLSSEASSNCLYSQRRISSLFSSSCEENSDWKALMGSFLQRLFELADKNLDQLTTLGSLETPKQTSKIALQFSHTFAEKLKAKINEVTLESIPAPVSQSVNTTSISTTELDKFPPESGLTPGVLYNGAELYCGHM